MKAFNTTVKILSIKGKIEDGPYLEAKVINAAKVECTALIKYGDGGKLEPGDCITSSFVTLKKHNVNVDGEERKIVVLEIKKPVKITEYDFYNRPVDLIKINGQVGDGRDTYGPGNDGIISSSRLIHINTNNSYKIQIVVKSYDNLAKEMSAIPADEFVDIVGILKTNPNGRLLIKAVRVNRAVRYNKV